MRMLTDEEKQQLLDLKTLYHYINAHNRDSCRREGLFIILYKYLLLKNRIGHQFKTHHFRRRINSRWGCYSDCVLSTGEIAHAITFGIEQGLVDVIRGSHRGYVWRLRPDIKLVEARLGI